MPSRQDLAHRAIPTFNAEIAKANQGFIKVYLHPIKRLMKGLQSFARADIPKRRVCNMPNSPMTKADQVSLPRISAAHQEIFEAQKSGDQVGGTSPEYFSEIGEKLKSRIFPAQFATDLRPGKKRIVALELSVIL